MPPHRPACLLLLAAFGCHEPTAPPRANIVLILTDDSGFSDIGCYGGEIETPNIDRLAENGIRFARFYTNARCSPTRASLLTGQYPHAVGVGDLCRSQDETPYPGYLGYLSEDCVTLAEVLAQAGYHTAMSGKWHLCSEVRRAAWPTARGFDNFFGLIHGCTGYFVPWKRQPFYLQHEPLRVEEGDGFYATDAITDHAVQFLSEAREEDDRPIFLYVAYTAPHEPLEAPAELIDKYRNVYRHDWVHLAKERHQRLVGEGLADPSSPPQLPPPRPPSDEHVEEMATIAAMTEVVDQGVGRLVQQITDMGELENTVFIYLSDNGGAGAHHRLSNIPFFAGKGSLRQGGLLTHCIVSWPAGIESAGGVTDQIGHVIDWMPTLVQIAQAPYPDVHHGEQIPPMAGESLLPTLRGAASSGTRTFFWDLYGQQAVLRGSWKYFADQVTGVELLFDVERDASERNDLAAQWPKELDELRAAHAAWAVEHDVLPFDVVQAAQGVTWRKAARDKVEPEDDR